MEEIKENETTCKNNEADEMKSLKELRKLKKKEKIITNKIKKTLKKKNYKYVSTDEYPNFIALRFVHEKIEVDIHIVVKEDMVSIVAPFCFEIKTNMLPIVSIFMANSSNGAPFSSMDCIGGRKIAMKYCYIVDKPSHYNEKEFLKYFECLLEGYMETHIVLYKLCRGRLIPEERAVYKEALECTIEALEKKDECDDEDIKLNEKELDNENLEDMVEDLNESVSLEFKNISEYNTEEEKHYEYDDEVDELRMFNKDSDNNQDELLGGDSDEEE